MHPDSYRDALCLPAYRAPFHVSLFTFSLFQRTLNPAKPSHNVLNRDRRKSVPRRGSFGATQQAVRRTADAGNKIKKTHQTTEACVSRLTFHLSPFTSFTMPIFVWFNACYGPGYFTEGLSPDVLGKNNGRHVRGQPADLQICSLNVPRARSHPTGDSIPVKTVRLCQPVLP